MNRKEYFEIVVEQAKVHLESKGLLNKVDTLYICESLKYVKFTDGEFLYYFEVGNKIAHYSKCHVSDIKVSVANGMLYANYKEYKKVNFTNL